MRFVQICGDWLSIARRQTAVIVVLCRGFVNDARTVKLREDGWMELGRVEKRKLCATARQFFVWQGRETAVVAELRQGLTDADRRKNGRCSVLVEFFNTP